MFISLQLKPDSNCFDNVHNTFIRVYQQRVISDKHCVTEGIIDMNPEVTFRKFNTSAANYFLSVFHVQSVSKEVS